MRSHKAIVSIVLFANRDGSHLVPLLYFGYSAKQRCFGDNRFSGLKLLFSSQKKASVDSIVFKRWLCCWYNEVRKVTNEDVILIEDNCGGHESEIIYPGFKIEFMPPGPNPKYQRLELGFIALSKIDSARSC